MTKHEPGIINKQDYEYKEYNYHNNNYNNIDTEPGVLISPEDGERIAQSYHRNIGNLTGAVASFITQAVASGLTVANILEAIEITGFAPRPSAAYLRAILRNWIRDGVTTSQIKYQARREQDNPALWYMQRDNSNLKFDGSAFMQEVARMRAEES